MVALLVSVGLMACTTPPVFNGVAEVIIHTQTAKGTEKQTLEGERLANAERCLYPTTEIPASEAKAELIQEVILVQVKDRLGDRMFEFYTDENFSGNKGKHYRNNCLYRILKQR